MDDSDAEDRLHSQMDNHEELEWVLFLEDRVSWDSRYTFWSIRDHLKQSTRLPHSQDRIYEARLLVIYLRYELGWAVPYFYTRDRMIP